MSRYPAPYLSAAALSAACTFGNNTSSRALARLRHHPQLAPLAAHA